MLAGEPFDPPRREAEDVPAGGVERERLRAGAGLSVIVPGSGTLERRSARRISLNTTEPSKVWLGAVAITRASGRV
jgi:hypothetical protein